jgi:hypothetical protein
VDVGVFGIEVIDRGPLDAAPKVTLDAARLRV